MAAGAAQVRLERLVTVAVQEGLAAQRLETERRTQVVAGEDRIAGLLAAAAQAS